MRCGGRHQCRSAGAKSPANARSCASSLPTSPALSIQFTSQEMQERRDALACSAPNLQVFPGQGPEDQNRTFPGGISNVTASFGQFLDNFMGVGGTGTNNVRCSPTWPGLHACLCCHSHSHALQQALPRARLPQTEHFCRPGEVVTGIHVAWEPAPVAPFTNLATGNRGLGGLGLAGGRFRQDQPNAMHLRAALWEERAEHPRCTHSPMLCPQG